MVVTHNAQHEYDNYIFFPLHWSVKMLQTIRGWLLIFLRCHRLHRSHLELCLNASRHSDWILPP